MDLSRFSIDAALFSSAEASNAYRSVFYERLLSGLIEKDENLFVRTDIRKEREPIFAFPALYWLEKAGQAGRRKALYLCFDEAEAQAACEAASRLAEGSALAKPVLLGASNGSSDDVKESNLLFATVQTFYDLLPTGVFVPRDFGFVIADQAEQIAEMPGEILRKIQGSLLPSWERKSLIITNKHTPKAKNFAWDFGDSPREIKLGETMGYAGTTSTISRDIKEADKIRFILQLLAEGENRHLCVFCNLKSMAAELSARLVLNGVSADYIAGNLNPDRKNQIITKALTWSGQRKQSELIVEESGAEEEGESSKAAAVPAVSSAAPGAESRFAADSFVLVLTDDGAKGLSRPEFITVVNYDLPLEPEFYFERLNFLKIQDLVARLYNLVCERYMYGLPAIERMIDASLSVVPIDSGIALPEDLSAGKIIEMPESRFRERGDRHGRGDHRGDGGDRYGREAPRDQPERSERPERGPSPRGEGRRAPAPSARAMPTETNRGGIPDPYAMSMEERLALYKKKYGKQLEQGPSANRSGGDPRRKGRTGAGPQHSGAGPQHSGAGQRGGRDGGGRGRHGGEMDAARRMSEAPGAACAEKTAAPPVQTAERKDQTQPEAMAAPNEKARGLFGKLQDLFGSHKD